MPEQLTLKEEKRLLKRLQSGDRGAFRQFYDAFSARVYRAVIYPRIGMQDVAEDILRDTFLTAFEKIGSVTWQQRSLYYWLSRIAYNNCIDYHRANKRANKFVEGYTPYLEMRGEEKPGPEQAFLEQERVEQVNDLVHELLEGLNPRYRKAVELRYFKGLEREECAEEMDVTIGNFDVILFRAIKRMKTLYDRKQNEEDS